MSSLLGLSASYFFFSSFLLSLSLSIINSNPSMLSFDLSHSRTYFTFCYLNVASFEAVLFLSVSISSPAFLCLFCLSQKHLSSPIFIWCHDFSFNISGLKFNLPISLIVISTGLIVIYTPPIHTQKKVNAYFKFNCIFLVQQYFKWTMFEQLIELLTFF